MIREHILLAPVENWQTSLFVTLMRITFQIPFHLRISLHQYSIAVSRYSIFLRGIVNIDMLVVLVSWIKVKFTLLKLSQYFMLTSHI